MSKKIKKTEKLGTITVLQQVKMGQQWLGNQRGMVHKSKKHYNRKSKYKQDYDRDINKLIYVL